jgi:hypothetical protein
MNTLVDAGVSNFGYTSHFLNPDDPIPEYRNNPVIGALGPIADANERFEALYDPPPFDESVRKLPPHLRAHAIRTLSGLFVPTAAHDRVMLELDILRRRSYINRNPLSPKYRRQIQSDRSLLVEGSLPPERFAGVPLLGAAVLGPPGTGKTTLIGRILSTYPQVVHHAYLLDNDVRLAFTQVVYLKINLFQDASLKAFAIEFFEQLGQAVQNPNLGAEWRVDRCNGNTAQPLIYRVAREYNLGLLVIDDTQNMVSNNHGYAAVLNYFIRIMNCLGLGVVLIGTNTTQSLLERDATFGRRFIGSIPPFAPMRPKSKGQKEDGPWEQFLAQVWRYQFVDVPSDYRILSDRVFELTGGIPDLVIKLYTLAQTRCFGRAREEVTDTVLTETASELFSIVADRLLELKGQCKDSPGVEEAKNKLTNNYNGKLNDTLARVGAEPVFAMPKPVIDLDHAAGESSTVSPPPEIKAEEPVPEHPVVTAGKSNDIKARLSQMGLLEVPS